MLDVLRDFNPRHPYGWRPGTPFGAWPGLIFQSTPPIRVATQAAKRPIQFKRISIHATHTGGDSPRGPSRIGRLDFNPRHPYGWRRGLLFYPYCICVFQSTPPIRVATCCRLHPGVRGAISIHATHTGGDAYLSATVPFGFLFQSTPPIRVATVVTM